jgi:hypothetical protein
VGVGGGSDDEFTGSVSDIHVPMKAAEAFGLIEEEMRP